MPTKATKSDEKKQQKVAQKLYVQSLAAARKGDPEACFRVARCLEDGVGCPTGLPQDVRGAEFASWLRKAADLGHADAQVRLGDETLQSHPEVAIAWYRKAASQGHVAGLYNLGDAYLVGYGVEQNFAEAAKHFRRVLHTDADDKKTMMMATFQLANLYERGEGVEQDHAEASRLYVMYTTAPAGAVTEALSDEYPSWLGKAHLAIAQCYAGVGAELNAVKGFEAGPYTSLLFSLTGAPQSA